jgi:hypothetical protein
VDISGLEEAGDTIYVKDIVLDEDISTTADAEQIIVKVSKIKIDEEPVAAEAEPEEAGTVEETKAEEETENKSGDE